MDPMTWSSAKKLEMLMTDVQHSDPYQGLVFIFQSVSLQAALPVAVDVL